MKHILLIIVLFSSCNNYAQSDSYSELKEFGLKGNIKSITQMIFSDVMKSGESYIPKDSTKWKIKTQIFYNSNGNCDSIINYSNNAGSERVISKIVYEYKDKERSGFYLVDSQKINEYRKYWTEKNTYKEDILENYSIVTSTTISLDDTYKIKQKRELFLDNDPKTINEAQVYFYYFDKDNYLEKITLKENNKEVIVEKIKELEFDAIGNATKSFKIKLPSNQQYLITRNFEYYD